MIRTVGAVVVALGVLAAGQVGVAEVLVQDDFSSLSGWKDLSTAVTWGGHSTPVSAFAVSGGTVGLTGEACANTSYTTATGLRTFTAIDEQFSRRVQHTRETLTIDIRMRWDGIKSAEAGRFNIILNYDYPAGGLDTALNGRSADFTDAWWARPAYHIRMRSGGTSYLCYGGGSVAAGEFEAYDTGIAAGVAPSDSRADWWLPGFIASPGSVSEVWVPTAGNIASQTWMTYRYVIAPDRQEIWVDSAGDGFDSGDLKATQLLPETSAVPLYSYFEELEGIRLFWRGGDTVNQAHVDWISVSATAVPEPTALGLVAGGAALLLLRRRGRPAG